MNEHALALETILRHLKGTEPGITQWAVGAEKVRRGEHGFDADAYRDEKPSIEQIKGLVDAVELLAKHCESLTRRVQELESR